MSEQPTHLQGVAMSTVKQSDMAMHFNLVARPYVEEGMTDIIRFDAVICGQVWGTIIGMEGGWAVFDGMDELLPSSRRLTTLQGAVNRLERYWFNMEH